MQDFPVKVDGVSVEPAAEYNNLASELKTVVSSIGQTFTTGSIIQLAQAIAVYSAAGAYYTDGGAANSYVLSVAPVTRIPVVLYFDGFEAYFLPTNTNTGASTVNISGLGAKAILQRDGVSPLAGGEIVAGSLLRIFYDGVNFRLGGSGESLATTTSVGLASFDPANFSVTNGLVSLLAGSGVFPTPGYESGYFSVASTTEYILPHSLGIKPAFYIIRLKGALSDTWEATIATSNDGNGPSGPYGATCISDVTNIKITTTTLIAPPSVYDTNLGTYPKAGGYSSGYYNVLAWK